MRTPAAEVAARADAIRESSSAPGTRSSSAEPHPDDALEAVHDGALLDFLAGAWDEWEAAGLPEDPGQDRVVPYVFAHPGLLGAIAPRFPPPRGRAPATSPTTR